MEFSLGADTKWALVIPMANEGQDFHPFVSEIKRIFDHLRGGHALFVVDNASKDNTRELCETLSVQDPRFITVWAPQNRNVVDAYFSGFRVAYDQGFEYIIEMDAGLSHDPRAIPTFLRALTEGNECAFGSRYINGGSMGDSPFRRRLLSKGGSWLAHWFLGARLADMTSGYEGFHRDVIGKLLAYPLISRGHFYQTEIRHLCRKRRSIEIPIHYAAPSPRVSSNSIRNSLTTLFHYTLLRLQGKSPFV